MQSHCFDEPFWLCGDIREDVIISMEWAHVVCIVQ